MVSRHIVPTANLSIQYKDGVSQRLLGQHARGLDLDMPCEPPQADTLVGEMSVDIVECRVVPALGVVDAATDADTAAVRFEQPPDSGRAVAAGWEQ